MPKIRTLMTPAKARNHMKRALREIVDPSPTIKELSALWVHFRSCCVYCAVQINPTDRTGHLDHLETSMSGGTNAIGNRVLACARCNGDERRESTWEAFLHTKCPDQGEREKRIALIKEWQIQNPARNTDREGLERALIAAYEMAAKAFDAAVADLRRTMEGRKRPQATNGA